MTGPTGSSLWKTRVVVGAVVLAAGVGGYLSLNWSSLLAGRAAGQLRAADSDESRAAAANKLVALGDASTPALLDLLRSDNPMWCAAVASALRDAVKVDPTFAVRCGPILAEADSLSDEGKGALLPLACDAATSTDQDLAAKGRDAVRSALRSASPEVVARAASAAAIPEVHLKAEVVPLLAHDRPEVRRAAMRVVGPAGNGSAVIGDEELFRWLNDPDLEVQAVCEGALATRGMDGEQITAAKKLTHPEPGERLKLLLDLRWGRDTVRDPGPWLERLSRDPDPAVRAGAARVAVECQLAFAGWLDRLAASDPDPTVREVAGFYRGLAVEIRQTGFNNR